MAMAKANIIFRICVFFLFLLQAFSRSTVKFLPGFSGPLPFELETGYISLGDSDGMKLFYYFVKSEGDPQKDPLIFWISGGPGCSGLAALFFENGPLKFDLEKDYDGSLPKLNLNPYTWTKNSSILFTDLPVGTGFSYTTAPQANKLGDFSHVHYSHQFLKKWLINHPEYIPNPVYVGGDSFSGLIIPPVTLAISIGNEHELPPVNLQGYVLGNPLTNPNTGANFAIPFAHRMTLISDELYESMKSTCKGEYMNIDPDNVECLKHHDVFMQIVSGVEVTNILAPKCETINLKPEDMSGGRSLLSNPELLLDSKTKLPNKDCPTYKEYIAYFWANDDQVRKALHVHKGAGKWIKCNRGLPYDHQIDTAVPYHVNLSSRGYRSLIISGDHDLVVPHIETQAWIKSLNYPIVDDWRPWFIADQVAGFTRTFSNNMTFATIKGGGHTPEFTPEQGGVMFNRWITGQPL